ncbi:MAG: hypothetical protein ACYTDY_12660, partial [Planctomycetota bacterium]
MTKMIRAIAFLVVLVAVVPTSVAEDEAEPTFGEKPASFWIKLLEARSSEREPSPAVQALSEGGRAAVPVLLWAINTGDLRVPENALMAMRLMGKKAESAVPVLLEKIRKPKSLPFARIRHVIQTLVVIVPDPQKLVPDLKRVLRFEYSW